MKRYQREEETDRKRIIHPLIPALASIVIPGLGHILARAYRKGLILILAMSTMIGLLSWRILQTGRRQDEILDKAIRAFQLKPILFVITVLLIILYICIIIDAYLNALQPKRGLPGIFILILAIYFGLGWQIGAIRPLSVIIGAQQGGPILAQILWPWERALEKQQEMLTVNALIEVPCSDTPPSPSEEKADSIYMQAAPTCGIATDDAGNPGTIITLMGKNFDAGEQIEIWWEDPLGNPFRQRLAGQAVIASPNENGDFQIQVPIPYRLIPPSAGEGPRIWKVQARQSIAVGELKPSSTLFIAIERMIETIFLGMMATFFGIILAIPISFLAARNLMSVSPITLALYYICRTILNIVRSIEPLIWAVIAIIVVGLGPFAGILALTLHSIAALGKLYSEAIESIDPGPIEAIQATGANWLQTIMFAVVPQIIPPFISFTIYRWDINVRMSTVIGLVGGGGIGFVLIQWIRIFDYRAAGIAVWFITITVAILDFVSAEIRRRYV